MNNHWGRFAGIVDIFTGQDEAIKPLAETPLPLDLPSRKSRGKIVTVGLKKTKKDDAEKKNREPLTSTVEKNPEWWGYKIFKFAVFMGTAKEEIHDDSSGDEDEPKKEKGFSEQDQVKAYMFAHQHQRGKKQGKTGLGASLIERDLTLGNDFVGSKKKFTTEEEEEEEEEEEAGEVEWRGKKDKKAKKEEEKKKKAKEKKKNKTEEVAVDVKGQSQSQSQSKSKSKRKKLKLKRKEEEE